MKKLIAIMITCLFVSAAVAADSTNSSVFQMRLVLDAPSADSERMTNYDAAYGANRTEVVNVQKTVLLDEKSLKSVKAIVGKQGIDPQINFTFSAEGRKRFAEVTRENIGKRLATVIGGHIYSAPKIMSEITSGEGIIVVSSGQEAKDLAAKINEAISKR